MRTGFHVCSKRADGQDLEEFGDGVSFVDVGFFVFLEGVEDVRFISLLEFALRTIHASAYDIPFIPKTIQPLGSEVKREHVPMHEPPKP